MIDDNHTNPSTNINRSMTSEPTEISCDHEVVVEKVDLTIGDNVEIVDETVEELQCEEVDMNDSTMDPLEWTVRTVLPIPKKYYWDTGNYNLSIKTKFWHRTVGTLGMALRVAEKIGEVLANITGLNSPRFGYITDHMNEEEWEEARKNSELFSEKRRKAKLKKEEGSKNSKDTSIQIV